MMEITITKRSVKMGAAVLIVAVGFWVLFQLLSGSGEPRPVSEEDGIITYSSGHYRLNATSLTDGRAEMEAQYEILYRGDPVWQSFMIAGQYMDGSFLVGKSVNDEPVFQVRPALHPTDGIPQAYIFPMYHPEQDVFGPVAYVDQEFREYAGEVRLAGGEPADFTVRSFRFDDEIRDGVYRDAFPRTVEPQWVGNNTWMVGNFTAAMLQTPSRRSFVGAVLS